jgi:dihydropteroate synthase type 2
MIAPRLFGIVNITEDSFSDGGRLLEPAAAIAAARNLAADGANVIDLGAAASNIDAKRVPPSDEIRRLEPVIAALHADNIPVSVDSFAPETQRFALRRGVAFLNDIEGFSVPDLYPELAAAECRLVVMHAVHGRGRAQQLAVPPARIWERIERFLESRVAALTAAGVAEERLILDPGMGFFLSTDAGASFRALAEIGRLKRRFGLPVLVSVSRKSFLAAATGGRAPEARSAATLAAELYAAAQGVDYIRTHDPAALRDALAATAALRAEEAAIR